MPGILGRAAILQGVEPDGIGALITQLQPIALGPRQVIFAEGDPGDRLYILTSGKVKIGRRSADGREALLTVLGPPDMFGELAIFDPGPRTSTATTLTAVEAVSLDQQALRAWIADRPQITEQLLRVLARRLRRTNDTVTDLIFTDVSARVAKRLLALAQRFGTQQDGVVRVEHNLTRGELAHLVGASRDMVNTTLADFTARGWIRLERTTIFITNSEQLAKRATR